MSKFKILLEDYQNKFPDIEERDLRLLGYMYMSDFLNQNTRSLMSEIQNELVNKIPGDDEQIIALREAMRLGYEMGMNDLIISAINYDVGLTTIVKKKI